MTNLVNFHFHVKWKDLGVSADALRFGLICATLRACCFCGTMCDRPFQFAFCDYDIRG